jgi:cold shock CspA family protein
MTTNLQLSFRDFPAPALAEKRITERVSRLERIYPRLIGCRVVAEHTQRRQHKGKLYSVRIDLSIPGGELVVNRDQHDKHAHEDFFVAMRDSFDAMENQLRGYAARQRGEVKSHEVPAHGKVSRMFPDYGFIAAPDGEEIYFHANSVVEGSFADIDVGAEVRFVVAEKEGEKGLQASTVRAVGKHHPA